MSIKFPYQFKQTDLGRVFDPTITLQVLSALGWQSFKFLVDSGADVTVLPLSTAEFFGVKIDQEKKVEIGGVEGQGVTGYPAKIAIKIGEEELKVRCFFIESEVTPLLGRVDVFNRFKIIFDSGQEELVFEKIGAESWFQRLLRKLR